MEIKDRLEGLGYSISAIASSGEEAIRKAEETRPNLVLMDIILKGDMDGVKAAGWIRSNLDIPVVYLTAYSDDETLKRAKIIEPFGYILKPFEERDLYSTIEMALYKHTMDQKLKESKEWLATTLRSIGDAVIATDNEGLIKLMNPVAEVLTGWKQEEALKRKVSEVFNLFNESQGNAAPSPVEKAIKEGKAAYFSDNFILISKDGKELPIDNSAAPIKDGKGEIIGAVLIFRDITERRMAERESKIKDSAISSAINAIAIADLDGKLTFMNNSFLILWGLETMEANGKYLSDLLENEGESSCVLETLKEKGNYMGELVALKKDGTPFHIQLSANLVKDKMDRPICIMASFIDITELKRAEKELKIYTDKLERADIDLEEFTDKLSRSFKDSLDSLQAFNEMLDRDYAHILGDKARSSLAKAKESTEEMNLIAEELFKLNIPISLYISLIELYQAKINRFRANPLELLQSKGDLLG